MEEKTLISSYDEVNDTFVGKVNGESGFCADYCISDGVYLGIDENNIFVLNNLKTLFTFPLV